MSAHLKMMMFCVFVFAALLCSWSCVSNALVDNIVGTYQVRKNMHYSNKTSVTWGENSAKIWNVTVSLSSSTATYDCSNTTSYVCLDPSWIYDYNKLWGKSRCGYAHGHHVDSDRFVWRRCSDPSCKAYVEGTKRVQLAAYSYDNGVAPFENPKDLMKEFATTIETDTKYVLIMAMDETGLSTFTLADASGNPLETQTVQHTVTCPDNYYEGTVQGWYFGGTCRAPEDVLVTYSETV